MNILFAAPENAWGGFFHLLQSTVPHHKFSATGHFQIEQLQGIDVLIPTMTPITEPFIETADRLKLIQQCGAGLEMVDIEAARTRHIPVCNVPTDISGNADSVAELGIYMMIGLSRKVAVFARSMAQGKMGEPQGVSLQGKTVGIIGLGGIGKALIRRLHAFDVRIMGIKRNPAKSAARDLEVDWVGTSKEIKTLLADSDYVILSLPLTPESQHLMNHETISMMKPNAFLINLSRGGVVDKHALEHGLATGHLGGAGLDVFWEEPPDPKDPVFSHNVIATPHIAGSTDVSMQGIVRVVAENIRRVERGESPLYAK